MSVVIENFQASGVDLALATLASLRAGARAQYTAACVGFSLSPAAQELAKGIASPPLSVRREFMKVAYGEVLALLPKDSPFRKPLTAFMEDDTALIKDP